MRIGGKYRAVAGSLPRRFEIAKWNEEKFLQFFEVVNYFTRDERLKVTSDMLIVFEKQTLEAPPSFAQEFLYRISQFTTDPDASPKKFMAKFKSFIRNVGGFLKLYPAGVTPAMKEVMEKNPRLSWMLSQYKTYETKIGAPVTVPDTLDLTDPKERQYMPAIKDPEVRMMEAKAKMADLFYSIVDTITKRDLKALDTKDKLNIAIKLLGGLNTSSKIRPNVGVFQQINIHKSDRDELEKMNLEFGES